MGDLETPTVQVIRSEELHKELEEVKRKIESLKVRLSLCKVSLKNGKKKLDADQQKALTS